MEFTLKIYRIVKIEEGTPFLWSYSEMQLECKKLGKWHIYIFVKIMYYLLIFSITMAVIRKRIAPSERTYQAQ